MQIPNEFTWDHDPLVYHECGLTGYTGVDPHSVMQCSVLPAVRSHIGWRGLYKGGLAVLPTGDLVAAACDAIVKGFPMHVFSSSDQGLTWTAIEHTPLVGKEPHLTCLRNGALLLTAQDLTAAGQPVYYSDDGGHTWSVTRMLGFGEGAPDDGHLQITRNPIEHEDGTLSLLRCWGHFEGSPSGTARSRVWLYHSTDGGRTWPDREEIETWDDPFFLFAEADFLRLPDGRILGASRFEFDHPIAGTKPPWPPNSVPNDHAAGHMVLLESSDEGRHWTPPRDFLNYSEVQGQLTLLADGRLLCTYTHYHLPFGVAAVLSSDLGRTWDVRHPFQLALSNGINNGWPTTRQLADGSLVTVYAIQPYHLEPAEKGTTVFQCVRWNVPPVR